MTKKQAIQLFEERKVRTVWDDEHEKWYFSIVDVVAILTNSENPQTYWRVLKNRLKKEGNETVTNCNALKLRAADGKMRLTDVADQEQLFRLIQSIPSPKAEPFKQWMAQVASQRIDQMQDPELSIEVLDKKRMENGSFLGEDYFEHLLAEIREIRLSERRFYQKLTDIYATAVDYNRDAPTTRLFFKMMQNKMHYAVHRRTDAELIVERADVQ